MYIYIHMYTYKYDIIHIYIRQFYATARIRFCSLVDFWTPINLWDGSRREDDFIEYRRAKFQPGNKLTMRTGSGSMSSKA